VWFDVAVTLVNIFPCYVWKIFTWMEGKLGLGTFEEDERNVKGAGRKGK
jgi:hypothetical protein